MKVISAKTEFFESRRTLILKNILLAKVNTLLRYGLAFVATSFLARNFAPDVFGKYQLVISYLAIFEAFCLVSPAHIRNFLAANPEKEATAVALWFWQNIFIFFVSFISCIIGILFSDEQSFWVLLLIASLRLVFRYNEYVIVISDQRMKPHLNQQVAIVQNVFFNIFRIIFSALKANIYLLCISSPLQGMVAAIHQKILAKKLDIKPSYSFDKKVFYHIFKDGIFLAILSFVTIFQSRIMSLALAEFLSQDHFGNFQLVVKLVEPATMLAIIIINANYSVLANSLQSDPKLFNNRFFKISLLIVGISFVMTGLIYYTPVHWLIRFFGEQYREGLVLLPLGAFMVISNTVFLIDQNFDFLKRDYIHSLIKYVLMLLLYLGAVFFFRGQMTISLGLWISILVPLLTSSVSLLLRLIRAFRSI